MKEYTSYRLVRSEDLNHHGTLFAGRAAELFVESAFAAAAVEVGDPHHVVCLNIHGMEFRSSVGNGEVIFLRSQIVNLGRTSIVVHTTITSAISHITPVEGFITFVHVDAEGKKSPHGLTLDAPADEREATLRERALQLKNYR